jgi:hypothetical protein
MRKVMQFFFRGEADFGVLPENLKQKCSAGLHGADRKENLLHSTQGIAHLW